MNELLAKSKPPLSLLQHTLDVLNVAEWLFGAAAAPTRLGREWLRFFKLPPEVFPTFAANLSAAAAFHDWGKANEGFQQDVHGAKGKQLLRHEHLSALMLGWGPVTGWLRSDPRLDPDLLLAAVLGHHLKAKPDTFAPRPAGAILVRLCTDEPAFEEWMKAVVARLELPAPSWVFPRPPYWGFKNDIGVLPPGVFDLEVLREQIKDQRLRPFEVKLRKDEARRRLLWAVRAGLIAADAAGSGLPREGKDMRSWLTAAFPEEAVCDEHFVQREVIDKRIKELEGKGKWQRWSEFQDASACLPARALLLAPCGSGKTLAAWRWIAAQVRGRPAARVLFLYPTRATAKEGFRDYVSWAPESDAALMHGTGEFDLQGMFENPEDPRHGNCYEAERRLFALGFWTRRVFSATVDQFMAFLQYAYGPVCMLPVLADAVVVIDEVHSFDRAMFSALKDFLRTFDLPVLCMTATLPNDRRRELAEDCGLKVYEDKPGELKTIAEAPRYRLGRATASELPDRVRAALADGKRVLWVVNQVKRAQQLARDLAGSFPADPAQTRLSVSPSVRLYCYHSRFRLCDRVDRHNEVVEAFRDGCPAALALTTQVCEMSLDMDADVLVTECCPITALIQRMGRCNRARTPRQGAGEVLVYEPEDIRPYSAENLTGIPDFLDGLCRREWINQAELEEALGKAPCPPGLGDKMCSFLHSGPYAQGGEEDFRDIEEFATPAVLPEDVARFLGAPKASRPGFLVPVPRRLRDAPDKRLPHYLAVARAGHYHAAIGFCDQPLAQGGIV